MIIPIINQKLLITDTSQEESKRVTDILEANNIEYYVKTESASGVSVLSRRMDATAASRVGYGIAVDSVGDKRVYFVYVKRRDYKRAKQLISVK